MQGVGVAHGVIVFSHHRESVESAYNDMNPEHCSSGSLSQGVLY